MTKLSLSPLRLILLALLGSAIIVGGVMSAVISLWEPRSLEAMIPADATVALFSNVTSEDVRLWSDDMPVLRNIPDFTDPLDLGVLTLEGGTQGWILTSRSEKITLPSVNGDFRGQPVLMSDPGVMEKMTGNSPRLRASGPFVQLSPGLAGNSKRMYLRANGIDTGAALPPLLRPLIRASGALLLSIQDHTATLRLLGTTTDMGGTVTGPLPGLTPAPDAVLVLGNPLRAMDIHLQTLPETERVIAQGMLAKNAGTLIGPGWSWTYDILPLAKEESTVAWKKNTGTGADVSYLLKSNTANTTETRTRLAAFHERFRTQLTGTIVTRRTLDKGVPSAILHSDPSQIEERQETRNQWTVRITREKGGPRVLLSAIRGREFFITNSEAWLNQLTGSHAETPLPPGRGIPIAGGSLSAELFSRHTADMMNRPEWKWLMSGMNMHSGVAWGVERTDHVLTLSVEENSTIPPVTPSSSGL